MTYETDLEIIEAMGWDPVTATPRQRVAAWGVVNNTLTDPLCHKIIADLEIEEADLHRAFEIDPNRFYLWSLDGYWVYVARGVYAPEYDAYLLIDCVNVRYQATEKGWGAVPRKEAIEHCTLDPSVDGRLVGRDHVCDILPIPDDSQDAWAEAVAACNSTLV